MLSEVSAKCPRCGSPSPKLHPAVQLGGEVQVCMDDFHGPLPEIAREIRDREVAADLARIFVGNASGLPDDIRSGKQSRHFSIDVIRNYRREIAPPADAAKKTMTISLTDREQEALERLMAEQELSAPQVFRCALRGYQADHERRKQGETVTWSGDAQRARDFAGPYLSADAAMVDVEARPDEEKPWVWHVWDVTHPAKCNHFIIATFDSNGAGDDFHEGLARLFAAALAQSDRRHD